MGNDLKSAFNEISSGWAKEREFQSRIQNLTNIKSVDGISIIKEARRKAKQIDANFGDKKNKT